MNYEHSKSIIFSYSLILLFLRKNISMAKAKQITEKVEVQILYEDYILYFKL